MASHAVDWKASVGASERYETIQAIRASLEGLSMSEAFAIEQKAFQNAQSRADYDATCNAAQRPASDANPPSLLIPSPTQASGAQDNSTLSGTRIGHYVNCTQIADGVTSDVYRSADRALKVIVANHPNEPHSPQREIKILQSLRTPCIPLLESFRDQEKRLVLVFPFMPLTLADLLERGAVSGTQVKAIFMDVLQALKDIHAEGIIHRDIKPSAVLLASPDGPAYLSDFGTAWHPEFSARTESVSNKILDIGTGAYRAPEVLFANKSYGTSIDMWAMGVMLAETIVAPPAPPFESRPAHEDGSQLGLILSIFKTMGTPTPNTWPEARDCKVSPFELWTVFPQRSWETIMPDADSGFRRLVAALVRFDQGGRATAEQALEFPCLAEAQSS